MSTYQIGATVMTDIIKVDHKGSARITTQIRITNSTAHRRIDIVIDTHYRVGRQHGTWHSVGKGPTVISPCLTNIKRNNTITAYDQLIIGISKKTESKWQANHITPYVIRVDRGRRSKSIGIRWSIWNRRNPVGRCFSSSQEGRR